VRSLAHRRLCSSLAHTATSPIAAAARSINANASRGMRRISAEAKMAAAAKSTLRIAGVGEQWQHKIMA